MSDNKEGQEPSMEEILASIRRIISEEGDGQPQKPAVAQAALSDDDTVMELTEMVADDGSVVDMAAPPPKPAPPPPPPPKPVPPKPAAAAPKPAARAPDSDLMSPSAQRAAQGAFAQLQHAVETQRNPQAFDDAGVPQGGQTIEAMVYLILKPMLREWVDRNLPQIVERMVAREIEKMTGG